MDTVGRHIALTLWMLAVLAVVVFVTSAREGRIHDDAWEDACATLTSGGAIPGHWPEAVNNCSNL